MNIERQVMGTACFSSHLDVTISVMLRWVSFICIGTLFVEALNITTVDPSNFCNLNCGVFSIGKCHRRLPAGGQRVKY